MLGTSENNLVLQIPLKFQVDRIKIFRDLLLAELKNLASQREKRVQKFKICLLAL